MTKVLHILTRLIRGGADENTVLTVAGLAAYGFDAMLLVGADSDPEYVKEAASRIKVRLEPSLRRNVQIFNDVQAISRLFRFIQREQFEIVHTHTAKAGFLGRLAAKMAGTPLIIHTVHGISFHDFRHPFIRRVYHSCEKFAARHTDRFIAVGENLKKHYLAYRIGTPDQYTVIHSGMELNKFLQAANMSGEIKEKKRREFQLASSDVLIGHVSRLDTGKGQQYLLEAAQKIAPQFPSVKFMLVGSGTHEQLFRKMVRDLHLEQQVIFAGFRPDIEEIMALFDIAVFTSLWEGLPRVVVQYAAVGKPIVAFDIPGVSEIVHHGVNGFTVPLQDVDTLAQQIIYLLNDPELAIRMGKKGHTVIDDTWQADQMIARIAREYRILSQEYRFKRHIRP